MKSSRTMRPRRAASEIFGPATEGSVKPGAAWPINKAQSLIARVSQLERGLYIVPELDVPQVNFFLIRPEFWRASDFRRGFSEASRAFAAPSQKGGKTEQ